MKLTVFQVREPFNAISHFIGAAIAALWLGVLMFRSAADPLAYRISFLVYGITVILMFSSSSVYHSVTVSKKREELFRLLDHIMIYLVIAGTYTPICVIVLEGRWRIGMLLGIWLFALGGVIKKIFWMNAPRWFSTFMYLLMGWVSLIIIPKVWDLLPHWFTAWILIGGLFYTVGAIIYAIEKPVLFPGKFGFHELWHLFVMGGAFSHFAAIYFFLPGF